MTGMTVSNITSVIELDPSTGTIVFSDNSIDFSLLTLGAAVEINGQYVGEAGIVSKNATTTGTATSGASGASGVSGVSGTAGASLDSQASTDVNVLSSYVGVVKIVEKTSGQVVFQQNTSDGTYAADMQLDENGYIVTIEKSFANGATGIGRVIKMDSDGNIFFQFGLAEMASPNDVRVLSTGNMMVST